MQSFELSDLTLEDLLPHRGDMLFVEEVLEVDSTHAVTRSCTKKNWPMADDTGVHPLVLVELAAQTSGVCNGWDRIHTLGIGSEKKGWLVGIKKAEFFVDHIAFGDIITARAENTYKFENLREVSCVLHRDDILIGKIILQLFQA